jgi:hypothetical protein
VVFELVALASDTLPTVSDLADPALADPVARGAATLGWLAAGAWLTTRPRTGAGRDIGPATAGRTVAVAMRTTPGRVVVLLAWVWLGVHFLAR